ncbi:AraC family transcriptional regulator [Mucilaginibacter hurinus]|uniref:AraC family transcriptional regulator n=1 Tax=Mucilaginibacter hurinus TaxID=2201324 RepID=A0A367GR58_9SPHI|nr:AraC family transcriptional regulator [Mucilaginibacter hurinus]RCH55740.1 AraC family transcriptional regulator [Mucilaginibacter hurinus]
MKPKYEAIVPAASNSFKAHYQEMEEFDNPWHYHPEYELTYIISSSGVRYVGNSFEDFENDDLVLLGPGLPHRWKNSNDQQDLARAVVIQWREDFIGTGWLERPEFEPLKNLLQLSVNGLKFKKSLAISLRDELMKIIELPAFERLMALLQLLNRLAQSKQYEILCSQGFEYNLNTTENDRLKTIFSYIENNYSKKLSLALLSQKVFMSEESFSRFFSKVMRKPFFYFLNEYRINMACKMLISTNEPVSQICYACGYESFPFFYRQFKKFKGCTPQKFRGGYLKAAVN